MHWKTWLMIALLQGSALAANVSTATWGAFTLRTVEDRLENATTTLQIIQNGQTKAELKDYSVKTAGFALRPGGQKELVVNMDTGGSACCRTNAIYSQDDGSLKLLAAFDGIPEYRDLNGDGIWELVISTRAGIFEPSWSTADGIYFTTVWGWDKSAGRFVNQTAKYPQFPKQDAVSYWNALQNYLKSPNPDFEGFWQSPLSGYYGSKILSGQKADALAQIEGVFTKAPYMRSWFNAKRSEIEKRVAEQNTTLLNGRGALDQVKERNRF